MEQELLKLAFVDMEFHKKTKSGDFLREIFSENFEIHDFWYDDTVASANAIMKDLVHFEYVFFFQVLLPYKDMIRLRRMNIRIIWAPMYDGLPMSWRYWKQMESLKMKLLCFSSAISHKARKHKMDHHVFRFFKKPVFDNAPHSMKDLEIFFWYRGNILFSDWIRVADKLPIRKIVYLSAPDPRFRKEIIPEADVRKYNIEIVNQSFTKKEDYIRYVNNCDIFICPRRQEGIGMTLVEAISMGKFLLGYNDNTMNDYIVHGKNGFLFAENTTEKLELPAVAVSTEFCRSYAINGYNEWKSSARLIPGLFFSYAHDKGIKINTVNRIFLLIEKAKLVYKKLMGVKPAHESQPSRATGQG